MIKILIFLNKKKNCFPIFPSYKVLAFYCSFVNAKTPNGIAKYKAIYLKFIAKLIETTANTNLSYKM